MKRIVSVDTGYSETKVYGMADGKPVHTVFPSTLGDCTFVDDFLGMDADDFIVGIGDKVYNFGETAIAKNNGGNTALDKDAFIKDYNPLLTLAGIARLLAKYPHQTPETLVVSLPIAFYKSQKPLLEEAFKGKHQVAMYKNDGRKTQSYQFNFNQIHVLPQGYMAFLSKALDPNGKPVSEFMNGTMTIIDGGGKTIDITRIQNGQMLPSSTSIPTGLDDIYRRIQDYCYNTYGECPERPQIEYQIVRNEIYTMANGQDVDFKALRQSYVEAEREAFLTRLRQAVGQQRIGKVFVCGGSGQMFFDFIKAAYPGAMELKPFVFANAVGGYRFALSK